MSKTNIDKIVEINLPKLGESITEATILNWLVKEGDTVKKDQALLEVATDKVDSEIPAPVNGIIAEIIVDTDDVVKVGEVLGKIEASKDQSTPNSKTDRSKGKRFKPKSSETIKPNPNPVKSKKSASTGRSQNEAAQRAPVLTSRGENGNFFSPLVLNIAKEHYISYEELARIPATGKEGRLRKSDIFRYIEEGRPAQFAQTVQLHEPKGFQIPDLEFDKGKGRIVKMDRMGQMIADHMVFSKVNSPHVTAYIEADMTDMWNWRNANKKDFHEKHDQKLTFTPLFVQAIAKAIKDFPMINASLNGKDIIVKEDINIGMAAALPDGNLIVPVVKKADTKDLPTLAAEVNDLAGKARENKLSYDEIQGGTFTISNVGTFGSLMGTPIINQPEAAILATGIIKKRAEVMEYKDGDKIEIRQMMILSLSFDHRFVGGHLAGSFLRRVADNFEDFK